ncbi:MAG TPA: O-antigen ligase family protein [Terriglobales bacterium]|nr:O-antigen ligase family protein [Terriglobales bacterium]
MATLEQVFARDSRANDAVGTFFIAALRPLHRLILAPSLLFLATLGLMLFHSPDGPPFVYDRLALGILIFIVFLRACVLRETLRIGGTITWLLLVLLLLALRDALAQPYAAEIWSVFAAKWFVPLVLFIAAANIFRSKIEFGQFETFSLIVFLYLSATAIFFITGLKTFIFPRFILDESLGIHADRARGPFLQAVANGVALNLLGLIALDSFRRGRLRGVWSLLLVVVWPLAILATKTRAVWFSFAASLVALPLFTSSHRLRRTCLAMVVCGVVVLAAVISLPDHHRSLGERLQEDSPVEFRMEIYEAGWEMFLSKPIAGWGGKEMQVELSRRISDFQQEEYYFHNTFLEILVQYGVIGLTLYLWMIFELFWVGRRPVQEHPGQASFLDNQFRALWPILLLVYLINAMFVVMNYQFVNGLVFSIAGMLSAQNKREEAHAGC